MQLNMCWETVCAQCSAEQVEAQLYTLFIVCGDYILICEQTAIRAAFFFSI